MLNLVQAVDESLVDAIFKSNMNTLYNDDNNNTSCRVVILNILNHIFIDTYVMNIIKQYKQTVLNCIPQNSIQDTENSNLLVILNDGDVNRLVGWAITKVKAKY